MPFQNVFSQVNNLTGRSGIVIEPYLTFDFARSKEVYLVWWLFPPDQPTCLGRGTTPSYDTASRGAGTVQDDVAMLQYVEVHYIRSDVK